MNSSITIKVFTIVFVVVLLAKGQAFINPVPSIDAWNIIASWNSDPSMSINLFLSQHRYGQALLHFMYDLIGFRTIAVAHSSIFLALALSAASSVLAARIIMSNSDSFIVLSIGASLIAINPNLAEIFTFSDAALDASISTALAFTSVWLALRKDAPSKLAAPILLALAISIYQLSLNFVAVLLSMRAVKDLVDGVPVIRSIHAGLILLSGLFIYAISILIGNAILDMPRDPRGGIVPLDQLQVRIYAILNGIKDAFLPSWVPITTSISALAIVGLGSLAVFTRAGLGATFLSLAFGAIGLASVVGAAGVGEAVWLVPRVLAAAGVFVAAWALIGLTANNVIIRYATTALSVIALLGYIAVNSQVFYDHQRVVRWDTAIANRIMTRLETLYEFDRLQTVVIIGGPGERRIGTPTQIGDLNISATYASWSQAPLIEQATGHRLRQPTAKDRTIAADYCSNVSVWPAPSSVTIIGETGAVCLGKN